ncbi:protein phosphatase 2C domain-containing protein [Streptomyces albiaxialis]|uniref:Protein phosphatase 2C domain-containing protein n=1 Tax=Streptomyces albiaxialis TaxID=329523 RepID=A0ABN2VSX6_9ACTN
MRIDMTTEPGDPQRPNEDYVSVALPASGWGGALVLLDGVTPPREDVGCAHGVPWFTARLGSAMLELSGSRRDMTLAECLAAAIARTAEAHVSTCDLSHIRTPQATVVAARWDEDRVEHLVLSDSALLVEGDDGEVTPVLDRRLTELPPPVRALRDRVHALRAAGETEELAAARAAYVRAVEGLRNAPDGTGFYTAAADPAVAGRAVTGTLPRARVRALLALTDGAARWTETFRLGDWAGLLSLVRKEGAGALVARVRTAESADPDCVAFRRGKRHDDAALALAELA